MIISSLITGFTIGIMGSFHCVGMCGPIALALPVGNADKWKRFFYILLYNVGRASAYSLIAIFFALIGKQIFIGNYQQFLSIILGVLILFFLFFSHFVTIKIPFFNAYTVQLKNYLSLLFNYEKHTYTFYLTVFLNGFLPCGLVYVALAGALATADVLQAILFMSAFGVGTFPIMFLVIVSGKYISMSWRNRMRKAVPFFIASMAVLLILRGLNLGIPYISPSLKATENGTEQTCCHK